MDRPIKEQTGIRSFVRREGRLTKSQKHALDHYWDKYGIPFTKEQLNLEKVFDRRAPIVIDIGVGTGDSTLQHALSHPENNYIAVEVHRPGIGQLINQIELNNINNIRIIQHDVIEVFKYQIPAHSISQIFIFFPDPWPKKKHHKRRLINKYLLKQFKNTLARHGRLHIATDWQDYAEHIEYLFTGEKQFINLGNSTHAPRPCWRPKTRYESRGLRLDHHVQDFCFALNEHKFN